MQHYKCLLVVLFLGILVFGQKNVDDDDKQKPPCADACVERDDQRAEDCCREQGFSTGYCRPWGVAHCLGERSLRYRRHKKSHKQPSY